MYLMKTGVAKENVPYIDFEKVASDLLMISIENSPSHNGLSYWRLTGMKNIPPLEIGVDYENGGLVNITFFVDLSCIKNEKVLHADYHQGNIMIDTNIFQKVNDYVDINETYEIYIQDKKCVCMFKVMEKSIGMED